MISDSQLRELADAMGTAPVYADPGSSAYNTAVANLQRVGRFYKMRTVSRLQTSKTGKIYGLGLLHIF